MILDIDIRRCAAAMIERYRDTADFEAAVRADEYDAMGERDVQRVWLRIAQAIEELRSVNRRDKELRSEIPSLTTPQ